MSGFYVCASQWKMRLLSPFVELLVHCDKGFRCCCTGGSLDARGHASHGAAEGHAIAGCSMLLA